MGAPLDLAGRVFGRLTAREPAVVGGRRGWWCDCECDGRKWVVTGKLTASVVRSCGCLEVESRGSLGRLDFPATAVPSACRECGSPILGHPNRRYCDRACKATHRRRAGREWECLACGRPFRPGPGQSAKRVYCSGHCETIGRTRRAAARRTGTLADRIAEARAKLGERASDEC